MAVNAVAEPLRVVTAPDGREVAFAVWGDPEGFPVMRLHGTPGCRLTRWPDEQVYASFGACFVTHDRAGYGRSSRLRGRRIVDDVDDVRLIADELGFERFGVSGGSGGGPHALACAARLPDRVVRALCAVGSAPYGPPGLDPDAWFAGMDPENVREFGVALEGEEAHIADKERMQAKFEAQVAADAVNVLEDFDLAESDRAQLARPETMQTMRESILEHAVNGVYGWADDTLALVSPWGFDVSEITVPVLIRYGISDVLVPRGHGEWLAAHVPNCIVKIDDAGHLGRDPIEEIGESVRWLRDGTLPA
jgi:pimeloyl-ACP methyl ester carboxylesterase